MKIMIVLSRVPYPLEKGDKLRAFHHITALSKNHRIILCCLNDRKLHPEAIQKLQPYCEEIHIINLKKSLIITQLIKGIFSSKPFQVHYFYQKQAQKKLDAIVDRTMPKHIFAQLIRTAEYIKKYRFIPITFDYMDAFSKGVERRIKYSIPLVRRLFTAEADRLKLYEADVFKYFKNKLIISEQDRAMIRHPDKKEIIVVANGVDTEFYKPANTQPKYDVVFVGNLSYPPNVQAAQYLVQEILPELKKLKPDISIRICGASPANKVKKLAQENVTVTGWMDDIRKAYHEAYVFAAPMQIGTGLQNKLLEAMACEKPAVTGELSNQALGAEENKEILIGKSPKDYAVKIHELLTNDHLYNQIAKSGYRFIKSNYDLEQNAERVEEIIEKTQFGTPVAKIVDNKK